MSEPLPPLPVVSGASGGQPGGAPSADGGLSPSAAKAADYGASGPGKPREDGLANGSDKARRADEESNREKTRERMAKLRALRRAKSPPVIPAPLPPVASGGAAAGGVLDNSNGLPPDGGRAQGGFVPWTPAAATGVAGSVVRLLDWGTVWLASKTAAEAGAPAVALKQIEAAAHLPAQLAEELRASGAAAGAEMLNEAMISSDKANKVWLATTVAALGAHVFSVVAAVRSAVAAAKESPAPQKEGEKPKP